MEFPIRRLVPSDAPAYRGMMLEAYERHPEAFTSAVGERSDLPLEWWRGRLEEGDEPSQVVFGAFAGEELMGVAGLAFAERRRTKHKVKLFGMYVRPGGRGAGMGRALVREALDYARSRPGLRVVHLTVTEGNGPARHLYESCGFVPFGTEPLAIAGDSGWLAKVYMWCDLASYDPA